MHVLVAPVGGRLGRQPWEDVLRSVLLVSAEDEHGTGLGLPSLPTLISGRYSVYGMAVSTSTAHHGSSRSGRVKPRAWLWALKSRRNESSWHPQAPRVGVRDGLPVRWTIRDLAEPVSQSVSVISRRAGVNQAMSFTAVPDACAARPRKMRRRRNTGCSRHRAISLRVKASSSLPSATFGQPIHVRSLPWQSVLWWPRWARPSSRRR